MMIWQPMQEATGGIPASIDRSAEKWQYWQSILKSPAWVMWGNAMGWTDVVAGGGGAVSPSCDWTKARVAKAAMPLTATNSHGFFIGSVCPKRPKE
jgi:hypothetical protein